MRIIEEINKIIVTFCFCISLFIIFKTAVNEYYAGKEVLNVFIAGVLMYFSRKLDD